MGQQAGAPTPWAPTGPTTGSPWEQNMMARLGGAQNPQDLALQQQMMATQARAGTGPQFQGSGRSDWQSVGAAGAVQRTAPGMGGPTGQQIQRVGQTMGSIPTDQTGGTSPGGAPARNAGYTAYRAGPMGQMARTSPALVKTEQPRWMGRG